MCSLFTYLPMCMYTCACTQAYTAGAAGIFICKQPRTLVCRMEREHKRRLEGEGRGEEEGT